MSGTSIPVDTSNVPLFTTANPGKVGLAAGALIVGTVDIDQTTPGTTNGVAIVGVNGATALAGNGATGTGSPRVTIASDNTPFPIKLDQTTPGTTNAMAVAQIGAATVLTGNGSTGTGALRVSIASDSTGIVALPAAGTSVVGTKAAGTAAATSALTGGVYNATVPTLTDGQQAAAQFDTAGALAVNMQGRKVSYRAVAQDIAQTAAGVMFQLTGSASKTVRITRITFSGILTTAGNAIVGVYKSSATNTGTQVAITPTKLDSGNAAASAAVASIVTPTGQGTSQGYAEYRRGIIPTATSLGDRWEFLFGDNSAQALTVRGTGEFVGIYVATESGVYTGAKFDAVMEFTEE